MESSAWKSVPLENQQRHPRENRARAFKLQHHQPQICIFIYVYNHLVMFIWIPFRDLLPRQKYLHYRLHIILKIINTSICSQSPFSNALSVWLRNGWAHLQISMFPAQYAVQNSQAVAQNLQGENSPGRVDFQKKIIILFRNREEELENKINEINIIISVKRFHS